MFYIQRNDSRDGGAIGTPLETVDEFETKKEAEEMRLEYQLSDPSALYYVSTRPCNDWRE